MTLVIPIWMLYVFAMAAVTTLFVHRPTAYALIILAFTVVSSYFMLRMPLGVPDPDPLPVGEWTLRGARIDVDKAIYVMVDNGGEPHLYRLPYSTSSADGLQEALNAQAGGRSGGTKVMQGADAGTPEFHPEPVQAAPEKTPEPIIGQ